MTSGFLAIPNRTRLYCRVNCTISQLKRSVREYRDATQLFLCFFNASDAWWVTDIVLFFFSIRIGHINIPHSFRWYDRMNECDGEYVSSSRQGHSGRRTDAEFNLRWITCSNTNSTPFLRPVLAPHRHRQEHDGCG